jgi:Uma2 family endonuclease
MRAVLLDVDEPLIAERERLGLDRFDEMWEGVLHVVPPPKGRHQDLATDLAAELRAAARRARCRVSVQKGVFATPDDYRVPDLVVASPSTVSERGVDGPPLAVIEILSPHDESYAKVPWYLGRGAGSVVIIDPGTYGVEVFTSEGTAAPDPDGLFAIPGLAAQMGPSADGRALLVETTDGTAPIEI